MYRSITPRTSSHIWFFGLSLLFLACFFLLVGTAEAKTVKRGVQSAPLEIAINIVGGSLQCTGDANTYPPGDGVKSAWEKPHKNADSPIRLLNAGGSILATPGTYTFTCTDAVSGKSDFDMLLVNDCSVGETWDNSTHNCVASGAETGNISATDCSIAIGASSCVTKVSWSTTNFIPPKKPSLKNNGVIIAGWDQPTGTDRSLNVSYGSNKITIHNSSGVELNDVTLSIDCVTGASWDGSSNTCRASSGPSGNISATSCTIPNNGSNCSSTVTWSSANFVSTPSVKQGATPISSSANGNLARNVNPGNKTFTLSDSGSTFSKTVTAAVTCAGAPAWSWDGTKCFNNTPAVNGQCGPAEGAYSFVETAFRGATCSAGDSSPVSVGFPARGSSVNWQCLGRNGGSNASCSASREAAPSPDFSLDDCLIDEENDSCMAPTSWDLQAGNSPYQIKNTTNGQTLSGVASTSNDVLRLDYGLNQGEASASGIPTLTDTGTASCRSDLFWHDGILPKLCKRPPQISINPANSLIRKGNYADVQITVTANYPTECRITGGNPSPASFTLPGSSGSPVNSMTITTGPHQATQDIEIECYAPNFPGVPGSSVKTKTRVNVLPNYQET